jgi:hypothetical protein
MALQSTMINRIVLLLFIGLAFWGCEDKNHKEGEDELNEDSKSTYSFDIIWEDTGITKDDNDYFHLTINRNSWQTLYRVRGIVKKNDVTEPFMKFYWESNLYWELGDTLGYYIHRGLTDDLEYVSYDTTYVTGFEGTLVPTSNTTSVSGEDGDVSNMIAPVKSMIGDTLTLSWYFFDWITGDYGGDGEMSFVLE